MQVTAQHSFSERHALAALERAARVLDVCLHARGTAAQARARLADCAFSERHRPARRARTNSRRSGQRGGTQRPNMEGARAGRAGVVCSAQSRDQRAAHVRVLREQCGHH